MGNNYNDVKEFEIADARFKPHWQLKSRVERRMELPEADLIEVRSAEIVYFIVDLLSNIARYENGLASDVAHCSTLLGQHGSWHGLNKTILGQMARSSRTDYFLYRELLHATYLVNRELDDFRLRNNVKILNVKEPTGPNHKKEISYFEQYANRYFLSDNGLFTTLKLVLEIGGPSRDNRYNRLASYVFDNKALVKRVREMLWERKIRLRTENLVLSDRKALVIETDFDRALDNGKLFTPSSFGEILGIKTGYRKGFKGPSYNLVTDLLSATKKVVMATAVDEVLYSPSMIVSGELVDCSVPIKIFNSPAGYTYDVQRGFISIFCQFDKYQTGKGYWKKVDVKTLESEGITATYEENYDMFGRSGGRLAFDADINGIVGLSEEKDYCFKFGERK